MVGQAERGALASVLGRQVGLHGVLGVPTAAQVAGGRATPRWRAIASWAAKPGAAAAWDRAYHLDHRDWIHDHHHRPAERPGQQAFDRLNPTFGVPADRSDPIGHRDLAQCERALSLGVRVAVHDSRQNDRNPVIWQLGQDYRMADAIQRARAQPTRIH